MTTRPSDDREIERRLLDFAFTTEAKITAPALAYFAPCSIEDAARVLDDLTARDRLSMEVEDDGTISYTMLGRQKLAPAAQPPRLTRALVPFRMTQPSASPLLAAALTVMLPGAGHLYAGRAVAAVLWFMAVGLGYALILPGLIFHMFAIASAAASAHRLNRTVPLQLAPAA